MSNFYGELLIRITSDTAGLSKGLQGSAAQVSSASKSMEAAGRKAGIAWERVGLGMQNIGRTMTQFVTLPIAAGFGFAAVSGYKYSKTLLQIRNLTGLTAKETQNYGQEILKLSKYGVAPQRLAEAMYFISSSGFKAAGAIKVLDVAAKASASGLGEVETIADVLTSALNAYGHENLSAARATDILMKTIEVGKAEPEALATSLGRIMPVAAKLGVPLAQVGGAIAGLTLTGLSSAEAVTALRGTMVALSAPAKMSIEELNRLGLSYQSVTRSIKKDGLLATMQMLYEKTDGNMLSMRKIIPNVRALNGVLSLLGPNYKKNVEITEQVIASQGKLARAYEATSKEPIQKFRRALASIQASFINIGIQIMPTVAALLEKIAGLFKAVGELSPGWRQLAIGVALFTAALGPAVMISGSFIRSLVLIKGAIGGISALQGASFALQAFKGGAATAAESAGLLLNSIGPLGKALIGIGVAAAVGIAFAKISDHLNGTTKRINAMRKAAQDVAADDSLRKWADKNLGGHLEQTGMNEFVFRPVVEGDVNMLANWVRTAKAKARAEENVQTQKDRVVQVEGRKASLEQQIQIEESGLARLRLARERALSAAGKAGLDQQIRNQQASIARVKQELAEIDRLYAQQTAKLSRTEKKEQAHVYQVNIDEAKAKIKAVKKQLDDVRDDLKKNPHDVKLQLKEERLLERIDKLKGRLKDVSSESYEIRLSIRIESLENKIELAKRRLERLKAKQGGEGGRGTYDPKIGADIAELEKFVTRGEKRLEKLRAMEVKPKVLIDQVGPLAAISAIQTAINNIQGKTVSVVVRRTGWMGAPLPKAWGGIFHKSTIVEVGEDGPEVILPLSKPGRMLDLMQQSGLTGDRGGKAGTAIARKAAATGARVAAAVAGAIGGALGGLKKKDTKKVTNAAEVSDAIQTLVDFISGISEALTSLEKATVPKLSSGWRTKIRSIVKKAVAISTVIAAEINRAFPWTKGRKGKGDKPDVEPKMGKRGTSMSRAAETSGPVQDLVDFVADMVGTFADLDVSKIDATIRSMWIVASKAREIVLVARDIAVFVSRAFKADATGKGGGGFTDIIASAASNAVQMANDIVSVITSFADVTEEGVTKAIAGMKATLTALFKTNLAWYIAAIAYLFGDVFRNPNVDDLVTEASGQAASLTGDLVNIISSFSQLTDKGVRDSLVGMKAVIVAMPALSAGIIRIIESVKDAFKDTIVDEKLGEASSAVAGIVGDITGMVSSLGGMTIEAVDHGIGGAYTMANRTDKFGEAIIAMVDRLKNVLGGIDVEGLSALKEALSILAEISGSISSIINDLSAMTIEKVTAATAAGSMLGQGFYEGLLSWHNRIITLARRIAEETAAALGAPGGAPSTAGPAAFAGAATSMVSNVTLTDNSRLVINLPPSLSPGQAREIARSEISAYEVRRAAAMDAARRGIVRR